jgi:hypothetical protein
MKSTLPKSQDPPILATWPQAKRRANHPVQPAVRRAGNQHRRQPLGATREPDRSSSSICLTRLVAAAKPLAKKRSPRRTLTERQSSSRSTRTGSRRSIPCTSNPPPPPSTPATKPERDSYAAMPAVEWVNRAFSKKALTELKAAAATESSSSAYISTDDALAALV